MLLILVLFSGVVGKIPILALAAVLIFAAASSLHPGRIHTVLRTGLPSQIAFFVTVAATIFLPVTAAVGIGVGLSLLLQVNAELPVVVLRLRGRTTLGATAFIVLADYAERLHTAGGRLFLSGVEPDLLKQLQKGHRVDLQDTVTVVPASDTILESTQTDLDGRRGVAGSSGPVLALSRGPR
jgi:MFS superfamily sulfate permease-like transporter